MYITLRICQPDLLKKIYYRQLIKTRSGLKVNEGKTEIGLFSRTNMPPVLIKISNQEVETKNQINVLGIIFDSNLQWVPQVTSTLKNYSFK